MKAVRTKSGRWQARYVDHYETVNGKRKVILGTVTRDTERAAVKAAMALENRRRDAERTVAACIDQYITAKAPVLSPSTLRSYRSLQRNAYDSISRLRPSDLAGTALQRWVGEYAATHSSKAVRNAYGLLTASVSMFDAKITATLPQKQAPDLYTPTDDDIKTLLDSIRGKELEKAVLLAAIGTMRRGEICALEYSDIVGDVVHVRHSLAEQGAGKLVLKAPKTAQSVRSIELPHTVIETLLRDPNATGRVVDLTPTAISNAFSKAVKKAGLPHFRFHDLRAYAASVRHALGIPDQYIMRDGGWKSDAVLKAIYRRTMADKEAEFTERVNDHFGKVFG